MNTPSYVGYAAAKPLHAVVIAALAGAVLGAALASAAPAKVKASLPITVVPQARQETVDYSYDGYYALRAAELVSDTMIGWLATPSILKEIHAAAGISYTDAQALSDAGRAFRARKPSSQSVIVTFSAPDEETAAKLSSAIGDVFSARASGLAVSAEGDPIFSATVSAPTIAPVSTSARAGGAAGVLVGAFAGFALSYVARARKNPQP